MPDFRGNIEKSEFKPEFANQNTTGPNAEGDQQTWANRPQLTQSSAQELADLMGAKLVPVTMGGPFAQDKPQWQLDFGGEDLHDASMVYDRYQRSPGMFNQNMADELAYAAKYPHGVGAGSPSGGASGPTGPTGPTAPGGPGGGGGGGGYTPPPANIPGPGNWPTPPPSNTPGPNWPTQPLPPMPQAPAVVLDPTTGVKDPGKYTPPPPMGAFAPPINLSGGEEGERLPSPVRMRPHNDTPVPPLLMPQGTGLPSPVMEPGQGPGGLLTLDQLKRRAGGYLPSKYAKPGGLLQ